MIFCDLDGTLLDIRSRYERAHFECAALFNGKSLDNYWEQKRSGVPEKNIALSSGVCDVSGYLEKWGQLLHEYVQQDNPLHGAVEFINRVKGSGKDIIILTARCLKKELTIAQVNKYFSCACVSRATDSIDTVTWKSMKIKELGTGDDVMIGDSEHDIRAAKLAGIKSIGVCSGIRRKDLLEQENPNVVVGSVYEIDVRAL